MCIIRLRIKKRKLYRKFKKWEIYKDYRINDEGKRKTRYGRRRIIRNCGLIFRRFI